MDERQKREEWLVDVIGTSIEVTVNLCLYGLALVGGGVLFWLIVFWTVAESPAPPVPTPSVPGVKSYEI